MTSEIAIASLLLDYINETSHTNNPGPSHLAQRGAWRRGALMVFDICFTAQMGRGEEGR